MLEWKKILFPGDFKELTNVIDGITREVLQACGYIYRYGYENRIHSRQPRVEICFVNYRYVSPECVRIHRDRNPMFYTLHFLNVLLANDWQFSIYIKHDTSESYSVGNVFDLGQKYN